MIHIWRPNANTPK